MLIDLIRPDLFAGPPNVSVSPFFTLLIQFTKSFPEIVLSLVVDRLHIAVNVPLPAYCIPFSKPFPVTPNEDWMQYTKE